VCDRSIRPFHLPGTPKGGPSFPFFLSRSPLPLLPPAFVLPCLLPLSSVRTPRLSGRIPFSPLCFPFLFLPLVLLSPFFFSPFFRSHPALGWSVPFPPFVFPFSFSSSCPSISLFLFPFLPFAFRACVIGQSGFGPVRPGRPRIRPFRLPGTPKSRNLTDSTHFLRKKVCPFARFHWISRFSIISTSVLFDRIQFSRNHQFLI